MLFVTLFLSWSQPSVFGAFKLKIGDRDQFRAKSRQYVERLIHELDRRFKPSAVQESLATLFDPQHLLKNITKLNSVEYGRSQLDCLRRKYKNFPEFDSNAVRNEWKLFKIPLADYLRTFSSDASEKMFWKNFIMLKESINGLFLEEYKNILILLNIYLILPTNSVEGERGVSDTLFDNLSLYFVIFFSFHLLIVYRPQHDRT